MLDYLGLHYDVLAALAGGGFTLILFVATVDDAIRRRRERPGTPHECAPELAEHAPAH